MQIPESDDENYSDVEVEDFIHRNSQAVTVLLASLCMEEYNMVNGLENVKEIWDTIKVAHEGNTMTKVTKMKFNEDELERFAMKREMLQAIYNRLKSLMNQAWNYGSKR